MIGLHLYPPHTINIAYDHKYFQIPTMSLCHRYFPVSLQPSRHHRRLLFPQLLLRPNRYHQQYKSWQIGLLQHLRVLYSWKIQKLLLWFLWSRLQDEISVPEVEIKRVLNPSGYIWSCSRHFIRLHELIHLLPNL